MGPRLLVLQKDNPEVKKLRKNLLEGWKDMENVLYHQGFPYILEIVYSKIISYHYNNRLVGYFGIKKIGELVVKKYF